MTHEINDPETPELLEPTPHNPPAGDWKDDDAQAYEDDFTPAAHGPVVVGGLPHKVEETPPTTRMLMRTAGVGLIGGVNAPPLMLFPADPNRKKLVLSVRPLSTQLGPAVLVAFGSDGNGVRNGQGWLTGINTSDPTFYLYDSTIDLSGHTGAVWVWAPDRNAGGAAPAAEVVVTAFAITL